ncbi:Putative uncharacterized protein [Taphrina deformans PYCC 5710]|uniref:TIGR02453 family protein n=1 Tax=Taphrina deformans (strain PYCC 5710 / ATCC 11124 / CBS 356.35 / IMI 108563 / JCM 9778 / NBRC 8474) TaxID=1097556 RepID=R4X727_TAPDE|nr:Putative uncharacterized protein [Taphrina deformans PYCC 5710]|eukprot:CCG80853.1 Putative uncharacterized protein [Taphrina deformans PYCC 5710]
MSGRKRSVRTSYVDPATSSDDEARRKSTTPKKSKYFKASSPEVGTEVSSAESASDDGSRVNSEDLESFVEDDDEEVEADQSSEDSDVPVKPKKARVTNRIIKSADDAQKRKIMKQQSETDEGTEEGGVDGEVFIAKLPALPAGDVEYKANTIHPNTLDFLRQLKTHNERDWFQQRELQYQATKSDFDTFVLAFAKTITAIDDTIPELPVKDLTFRIYRDIRFSNDRTPYKTFLAAYYSRSGRKGPWAGYYFSLEPGGKTLLACGLWQPPALDLAAVRESIDTDIDSWTEVIEEPAFEEFFGGRAGLFKTEDKLKTCPKGYPKDHENIELLRLKSFNVRMNFSDEEVLQDGIMDILALVITQMHPFVRLLNSIIRPDDSDEN